MAIGVHKIIHGNSKTNRYIRNVSLCYSDENKQTPFLTINSTIFSRNSFIKLTNVVYVPFPIRCLCTIVTRSPTFIFKFLRTCFVQICGTEQSGTSPINFSGNCFCFSEISIHRSAAEQIGYSRKSARCVTNMNFGSLPVCAIRKLVKISHIKINCDKYWFYHIVKLKTAKRVR